MNDQDDQEARREGDEIAATMTRLAAEAANPPIRVPRDQLTTADLHRLVEASREASTE